MTEPGVKITHVAAAVIIKPDGSFLLAQRPEGKPYPGFWEFPGGKIELGESAADALKRELREELDIEVTQLVPWIVRKHVYTHATVLLRFFRVTEWRGEPKGLENQAFTWQRMNELTVGPMLPANAPIFQALLTPTTYLISNMTALGDDEWFARVQSQLTSINQSGIDLVAGHSAPKTMVQIRERFDNSEHAHRVLDRAFKEIVPLGARLMVNSTCVEAFNVSAEYLAQRNIGLHLTSQALQAASVRPDVDCCGASCHTLDEIEKAHSLGCDYILLGPVLTTGSHLNAETLGWSGFSRLIDTCAIPCFALGGQTESTRAVAYASGAHGIAMMRGY